MSLGGKLLRGEVQGRGLLLKAGQGDQMSMLCVGGCGGGCGEEFVQINKLRVLIRLDLVA